MKVWLPVFLGLGLLGQDVPTFRWALTNDLLAQRNELATRPDQFQNSTALLGTYGHWSAGLTLRGANFFIQDPSTTLPPEWRIYRSFVRYSDGGLSVQAGDFYALLGRGMVLSVLQNDKALRERTIQGAELTWNGSDLDVRALAGRVRTEKRNQEWRVFGAETTYTWMKGQRLGVRASHIQDVDTLMQLGDRTTSSFNLSGELQVAGLSYYGESARLTWKNPLHTEGRASYGNLSFHRQQWVLTLEARKYKNFDNELNNPPLADRDDELVDLYDSQTHRLHTQFTLPDTDLMFFGSAGRIREGKRWGSNAYGGFTLEDWKDKVSATLSFGVRDVVYPVKKLEASFTYRFTPRVSLELSTKEKRYATGDFRFRERDDKAQLAWSAKGSLFLLHQSSEVKVMGLNHLFSGGLRIQLKADRYLELSGGRLRGGEICAGGQCIFLPPYRGWKFGLHWTY